MIVSVTVVTAPATEAELAADRLMQAGAFAVEERALDDGRVELRAVLADTESAAESGAISFAPPAHPKSPINNGCRLGDSGTAPAASTRCRSATRAAARWGCECRL